MRPLALLLCCLSTAIAAPLATACDRETGERPQSVQLSWNGQSLKQWTAAEAHVEAIDLPNGFHLGVRVEPADREKYEILFLTAHHVPELVKITLLDLGAKEPRVLSTSWGGSNSVQTYGAGGGSDQVDALGDPGIELILLRPVCAVEPGSGDGGNPAAK